MDYRRRLPPIREHNWLSKATQQFFANNGICHTHLTAYHQQADGLAERSNKSLFIKICHLLNPLKSKVIWSKKVWSETPWHSLSVDCYILFQNLGLIPDFSNKLVAYVGLTCIIHISPDSLNYTLWYPTNKDRNHQVTCHIVHHTSFFPISYPVYPFGIKH